MNTPTFDYQTYKNNLKAFPSLTFEEFQSILDLETRKEIIKRNKILQTDAYNRTMNYLKGESSQKEEVYTLSFRRSTNGSYNIVAGVRNQIKEIFDMPLLQHELDFAEAFYADQAKRGGNGRFDKQMWQQVIDQHGGYVPLKIFAVADGTALKVKDPVMVVKGQGEIAAKFEPQLLRIFYTSAVATDIHYLQKLIGSGRVVEFGKRSTINEDHHLSGIEGTLVGGDLKETSNDAAAAVYPQVLSGGTTAHRYFACYHSEDEAFEVAIQKSDKISLLVDLIDSYQGIDKIIDFKKNPLYAGKSISMRLDSGDLKQQAVYALTKLQENGLLDPKKGKVIVSDISSIEDIVELEECVRSAGFVPEEMIVYGLGGLLIAKNKLRDALSAAYKLTQTEDGPTGKLSNDIGKQPIPGVPNVEIRSDGRWIVQEDEEVQGERLLQPVYDHGKIFYDEDDLGALEIAQKQRERTFEFLNLPTSYSQRSQEVRQQAMERLLSICQEVV